MGRIISKGLFRFSSSFELWCLHLLNNFFQFKSSVFEAMVLHVQWPISSAVSCLVDSTQGAANTHWRVWRHSINITTMAGVRGETLTCCSTSEKMSAVGWWARGCHQTLEAAIYLADARGENQYSLSFDIQITCVRIRSTGCLMPISCSILW